MKHPEAMFIVEVTADDEIVCRAPKQAEQRIGIADLGAVYVETNDSGPWAADVWWLLNDKSGQQRWRSHRRATGEDAALERLHLLPGFEVRGMNIRQKCPFPVLADAYSVKHCRAARAAGRRPAVPRTRYSRHSQRRSNDEKAPRAAPERPTLGVALD
jgi:hypothetical protein